MFSYFYAWKTPKLRKVIYNVTVVESLKTQTVASFDQRSSEIICLSAFKWAISVCRRNFALRTPTVSLISQIINLESTETLAQKVKVSKNGFECVCQRPRTCDK